MLPILPARRVIEVYILQNRMFDKPALAAVIKFKYKPRVVDGEAIATSGVKNMITFELDEMQNQ